MDNPQSPHRSDSQKLQALIMRPMRMLSQIVFCSFPETRQSVKGKEETLGQVSAAHSHGHRHAERLESQRPP